MDKKQGEQNQGAQNLNDFFSQIINSQKGISPEEEAEFVAAYLPDQNKQVKFVNTSKWIRAFFIVIFIVIFVSAIWR